MRTTMNSEMKAQLTEAIVQYLKLSGPVDSDYCIVAHYAVARSNLISVLSKLKEETTTVPRDLCGDIQGLPPDEVESYRLDEALFALTALVEEFNCLPRVQKTSVQECMKAARDYRVFVPTA
jgi:hypothetical protein